MPDNSNQGAPARGLSFGPRRIDGARPALFERLLDPATPRVHDAAGLRDAIIASLTDLLSVRPPAGSADLPASARTVIDYGAAPEPGMTPAREDDRNRLAAGIVQAIAAFEPRLADPQVAILFDPDAPHRLAVRIAGRMRLGRLFEPFAFTLPLGDGRPPAADPGR